MRGSFCQALPIGCMRVFMTPSCSSAVTLESRCSGTLNSLSSWRRTISSSWLRVSTSSETIVIRCSSVSTLTRIDWLATLSASLTGGVHFDDGFLCGGRGLRRGRCGGFGGRRGLGAAGASVSIGGLAEGALQLVERHFARAQARAPASAATSVPSVISGCFCGLRRRRRAVRPLRQAQPRLRSARTMRSSSSIRSRSLPSGSASVFSSSSRISLRRSMVARISETASPVTALPSRNRPISVSAACASASRRGSPRKPQVPLMVWTRRKMLSRILALFGSCSNLTSWTSTRSRLSLVSVRNSRRRSSMKTGPCR